MADYKGQVEFDETKIPVFEADNDDFTLTLYNLNYVINVNNTQCDTRNGTQGGAQDKLQKQIFDMIEENLQISTSEIATRLGVGVRTVKRRIKQMTNMVYVANGYSGHWEIKYFLNKVQKCILDILRTQLGFFVLWKLHDKKSIMTGAQKGVLN